MKVNSNEFPDADMDEPDVIVSVEKMGGGVKAYRGRYLEKLRY
jgi:hypothetical protein